MNLILLGAPGSGKGTQAAVLAERLGLPAISTGALFRAEMAARSPLGEEVRPIMEAGHLVPDDLTIRILRARLSQPDCRTGFILDGFPRTLPQAQALAKLARIDAALSLTIPDEAIVSRLSGRLTCPSCSAAYSAASPPKRSGFCDRCNTMLSRRSDDSPAVVKERLAVYQRQTMPLLSFYHQHRLLVRIDADAAPAEVTARLLAAIANLHKPSRP